MDAAEDLKYQIQDGFDAKSSEKTAAPASELVTLLRKEETYWQKANLPEIVERAKAGTSAATQLLDLAKANRLADAASAFVRLNASCTSCHDQHPEKLVQVQGQ
jgi:cytochrome c556